MTNGPGQSGGGARSRRAPKPTPLGLMVLSLLAYFDYQDERIIRLVEHLLGQQMPDGGWNCQSYQGATHSSFHTTITVLEGLREYEKRQPDPRLTDD